MVAAYCMGTVARLHVSGDFTRNDALDLDYLGALEQLGRHLQAAWQSWEAPLAWTYTHHTREQLGEWHERLALAGIRIRFSDQLGHDGVIVAPFDLVEQLRERHPGLTLAKCPAQLSKDTYNCIDCKLCWEKPEVVIVFQPHGWNGWRMTDVVEQQLNAFAPDHRPLELGNQHPLVKRSPGRPRKVEVSAPAPRFPGLAEVRAALRSYPHELRLQLVHAINAEEQLEQLAAAAGVS